MSSPRDNFEYAQWTTKLMGLHNHTFGTGHDSGQKAEQLISTFLTIMDSGNHSLDFNSGSILNADERDKCRSSIETLATTLFDGNGKLKKLPASELHKALASSYEAIIKSGDFSRRKIAGTLAFFTLLNHIPNFQRYYGSNIDFRRVAPEDYALLRGEETNSRALTSAFEHALDGSRSVEPTEQHTPEEEEKTRFPSPPNTKTTIGGLHFLEHKKDGISYLVTANGGLVPRTQEMERTLVDIIHSDKLLSSYKIPLSRIEDYLDDALSKKESVDGVPVKDGVPLVCMEANPLTGLVRDTNHKRLITYLDGLEYKGKDPLFQLNDPTFYNYAHHNANDALKPLIEAAAQKIKAITPIMDAVVDKAFEGLIPVEHPHFYMTMGGGGSGKGSLLEKAQRECNGNAVITSLDALRKESDLYTVLERANHHANDYVAVEEFGNTLRNWIAHRARDTHGKKYNLIFDGSGIEYNDRYKNLVDSFCAKGFEPHVIAVDCMLHVPDDRRNEFPRSGVERIDDRARDPKEPRWLVWNVGIGKNVQFPQSFWSAFEHGNLKHLQLYDNAGPEGTLYLLAEMQSVTPDELKELFQARQSGNLLHNLREKNLLTISDTTPPMTEDNVDFRVSSHMSDGKYRVMVMNNMVRMTDFQEKGLLDIHAVSAEQLPYMHERLSFNPNIPNGHDRHGPRHEIHLNTPPESYVRALQFARNNSDILKR